MKSPFANFGQDSINYQHKSNTINSHIKALFRTNYSQLPGYSHCLITDSPKKHGAISSHMSVEIFVFSLLTP